MLPTNPILLSMAGITPYIFHNAADYPVPPTIALGCLTLVLTDGSPSVSVNIKHFHKAIQEYGHAPGHTCFVRSYPAFGPMLRAMPIIAKDVVLKNVLVDFGVQSGLFGDLHLHAWADDPKEFEQWVSGSELLTLALQQVCMQLHVNWPSNIHFRYPENGLPSRVQAAFATFLCRTSPSRPVIVETNSEYIFDRVRFEVTRGTILPEQVSILYFEKVREGRITSLYQMQIDTAGNIIDPPPSFHSWEIMETSAILTRVGAGIL